MVHRVHSVHQVHQDHSLRPFVKKTGKGCEAGKELSGSGVLNAHTVHTAAVGQQHTTQCQAGGGVEHAAQNADSGYQEWKNLIHGIWEPETHLNLTMLFHDVMSYNKM
jgi:hypothetical protein